MILEVFYFVAYIFSVLFLFLSIIFVAKYSKFQDEKILKGINTALFGLIFMIIYVAVRALVSARFLVVEYLKPYLSLYDTFVSSFVLISNLSVILVMSLFYLISVITFKEVA
ncbi:hypothetical protein HYX16_02435 [Candidatus Woesearchaeota archaeon]|nr:hypothetical protein [Candidatus Woesearchaeota archaeon]